MVNSTLIDVAVFPLNSLTNLAQALGGLIAVSIIFGIINVLMNRRRGRELKKIKEDISLIKKMLSEKKKRK
ncbi:MAG: hypothetical protein KJ905_03570 [Nanoarchaeota archaeon]|nr:hypothetical protein [Nanoarchaeota archaeon]MBU1501819.1 hypothetical protein [Nanoarchaeota archaeon]MBU2459387.1 hypothetical protein [Nanoarchaeota archaeon]